MDGIRFHMIVPSMMNRCCIQNQVLVDRWDLMHTTPSFFLLSSSRVNMIPKENSFVMRACHQKKQYR